MNNYLKNKWIKLCMQIILGIGIIYFIFLGVNQKNTYVSQTDNTKNTPEISLETLKNNLKDFQKEGNTLKSVSDDPWIDVHLKDNIDLNKIVINIKDMSVDKTHGQIFYDSNQDAISGKNYIDFDLVKGNNTINFPSNTKAKVLRLDLTDKANVTLNIDSISLNNGNELKTTATTTFPWGVFVIVVAFYCIFILLEKFYNKKDNIQKTEEDIFACNDLDECTKQTDILSFFVPVLCALGISCLILTILFPITWTQPERFYDIIAKEVAENDSNKSGELRAIWMCLFIGTFSVFIFYKLYNKFMARKKNKSEYIDQPDIYLKVIGVFIIPMILLWFITGNINTFIVICGGLFLALLFWQNNCKDTFYKENEFAKKIIICIVITYYMVFGIVAFINTFTSKVTLTGRIIQIITFVIVIWISYLFTIKKNIKLVDKIILLEQAIIPLILFIYLINRYKYQDQVIKLDYPKNYVCIIAMIMCSLSMYALLKYKKIILNNITIKSHQLILLSTVITIFIFNMYRIPNYIYSTDLWHTGEILLPWHQIFDKGLIPYGQYSSEAGLFPLYFGFIHNVLLDGTAISYNFAWALQYAFIAILTGAVVYYTTGGTFAFIIGVMFSTYDYDRTLLMVPVILLLANQKLINKKMCWIQTWIMCCFISGLYYPIYGVAVAAGTLPFAIGQIIMIVRGYKSRTYFISKKSWIIAVIEIVIILVNIPLLFRMIKHILLMSSQSILADGITVIGRSQVPDWFGISSNYKVIQQIRQILYCVFEFSIPIFYSIVFVFLLYLFFKNNKKSGKLNCMQSPVFLLLCTGAISVPITYTFGFIRMDGNWMLARASVVLVLFTSIILPTILWKYGKFILKKSTAMLLMGISFSTSFLLIGSSLGSEVNNIKNNYEVTDQYVYVNGKSIGIDKLGSGFLTRDGLNVIQTVNDVRKKVLKENEKIFLLSGNQALYYILDQSTIIPDAAIYAVADGKTQSVDRNILDKNPPKLIQWNSDLSVKNYYLYVWMIEKGYIPYSQNGVNFFVEPQRYEEIFGNSELAKSKMLNEYDTGFFNSKDLNGIANSWGKSINTLTKIFNEYKNFDTKKLNVETNGLIKDGKSDDGREQYALKSNDSSPAITIDLNEKVLGQDADFLYLDLNTSNLKYKAGNVTVYWETDKNPMSDKRSFICRIGDGKLLIPLGAHPSWLLSNNTKIRISFNGCEEGTTFSIEQMKLLKLNQEWMGEIGE